MSLIIKGPLLKYVKSNGIISNTNFRSYARWSHRQPKRVLTPEEYAKSKEASNNNKLTENYKKEHFYEPKIIELDPKEVIISENSKGQSNSKWIPKEAKVATNGLEQNTLDSISHENALKIFKQKRIKYKPNKFITTPKKTFDMVETVFDADGNLVYTKLQDNDPVIGQLLLSVKSRKEQIKGDMALIEGKRLIKEALRAKCTLKALLFSRKNDLEDFKLDLPKSGAKLYKMPYNEIQLWSDLSTSPGVIGLFKTPNVENYVPSSFIPLTLICDNIREPGNLGAILRTAAGVGVERVILTKGCVNLWDTKVLRSASGSHFHLKIQQKLDWEDIKNTIEPSASVFIADNRVITENIQSDLCNQDGTPLPTLSEIMTTMPLLPYYGVEFNNFESLVLIIGGETEGISEESYRYAAKNNGHRLNIPLDNDIESLNSGTSLGIIASEIKRQMEKCKYTKRELKL